MERASCTFLGGVCDKAERKASLLRAAANATYRYHWLCPIHLGLEARLT